MALNKLKFNSINVTPAASKALKFNSSANGFETGSAGGAMTFIKKITASSSSTLSFVDGSSDVVLDNTYKEYIFYFVNMHPATDGASFQFQANAVGGSGYNETITSTFFRAYHGEFVGGGEAVGYESGSDLAQSTSFQRITEELIGNNDDECMSGFLHLFNPSSTTFVKHFIANTSSYHNGNYIVNSFVAGYFNTTNAIDEIQFKMNSGNIDAGTITLYGIN